MKKAFTIFEIMLAISLVAMVAAFAVPVFSSFQTGNDLQIAADVTVASLRRAQTLSRNGEGDSTWGVYIQNSNVKVFKGASYASRDTDFDEDSEISNKLLISGPSEIVFEKLTGDPQTTGTITYSTSAGENWIITINSEGKIDY